MPTPHHDDSDDAGARRFASLTGLALILLLLVLGLALVRALHWHATIEDCLMAGHRSCQPISQ
jgi:hypothetical protein